MYLSKYGLRIEMHSKVAYLKYYKNCGNFLFWGRLCCQGSSEILVKYLTFFHRQNKSKILVSLHCKVSTNLINIKMRKRVIFALKCTFLGQNRLRNIEFNVSFLWCKMPMFWKAGMREGGRKATPTSTSIFDFYGIETLWFEFGNDIFTSSKMPTLSSWRSSISLHKVAEKRAFQL